MSSNSREFESIFNKFVETGDLSLRDKACEILIKKHSIFLPLRTDKLIKGQSYPWDTLNSISFIKSFMVCKSEGAIDGSGGVLVLSNQSYTKAPVFQNYSNYIGRFSSVCGAIAASDGHSIHCINVNGKMELPLQLIRDMLNDYHQFLPMQDFETRGKSFNDFVSGKGSAIVSVEGKKLIKPDVEGMLRFWVQGMTDIKGAILCVGTHDISEPDKIILNIATDTKETCRFIWDRFRQDLPQLKNENVEIIVVATPLNTFESRLQTKPGSQLEDCIIKIL